MQETNESALSRWFGRGVQRLCAVALALLLVPALGNAAEEIRYYHTDAFGSVAYITDEHGNIVERFEYEPYGQTVQQPMRSGPGYTGHVQDPTTGLVYMQQRLYDPQLGRFPSVDPVTVHGSGDLRHFNRYVYAYNNPYKFTDPDGRLPIIIPIVAGITWMLTPGDAHAPAPGQPTGSMSAGDAADKFMSAVPAGKLVTGLKMGADASQGARRPTQAQREAALERSKGQDGKERCTYCETPLDRQAGKSNSAEIDHKQAYSRGGRTADANLGAACRSCNRGKGAKELGTEWIPPKDRTDSK